MILQEKQFKAICIEFKTLSMKSEGVILQTKINALKLRYGYCSMCNKNVEILESLKECKCAYCLNDIQ